MPCLANNFSLFFTCPPQLKDYYEHSVQDRNAMGLQLIERNEEVCVFHEKLNVQGAKNYPG